MHPRFHRTITLQNIRYDNFQAVLKLDFACMQYVRILPFSCSCRCPKCLYVSPLKCIAHEAVAALVYIAELHKVLWVTQCIRAIIVTQNDYFYSTRNCINQWIHSLMFVAEAVESTHQFWQRNVCEWHDENGERGWQRQHYELYATGLCEWFTRKHARTQTERVMTVTHWLIMKRTRVTRT